MLHLNHLDLVNLLRLTLPLNQDDTITLKHLSYCLSINLKFTVWLKIYPKYVDSS